MRPLKLPFSANDLRRELVKAHTMDVAEWPVHEFRQLVTQAIYGASRKPGEYLNAMNQPLAPGARVPLVSRRRLYGLFVRAIGKDYVSIDALLLRKVLQQAIAAVDKDGDSVFETNTEAPPAQDAVPEPPRNGATAGT
jgi:hypothetical protein